MSNAKRAEVTLQLDKPRVLRLDYNAMCEVEEVLGRSIVRPEIGLRDIRAIVWAGIRHEDKKLTLEEVGALLGACHMTEVMEQVGQCLVQFFNQGEVPRVGDTSSTG